MSTESRKICVAMSGGVDSSAAAYLLTKDSHQVIGVTMCLGVVDEQGRAACCGPQAINDARRICTILSIPHYVLDFSKNLQNDVVADFISEYAQGRTPNPCIRCNRYLKFTSLYEYAASCGFTTIATGHYAKIGRWRDQTVLMRHHDITKDQSYFLCSVPRTMLDHILFPLATYRKTEVRSIASQANLPVATKAESQEICFITDDNYRRFLAQHGIIAEPGPFIDTAGKVLGTHRGIFNYTIGQRKGLGIATGSPRYVVAIDIRHNSVILGGREDLIARSLKARNVNLLVDELPERCTAKIRYSQNDVPCEVKLTKDAVDVRFTIPVEAVTPGQSVVLYAEEVVLGGAVIEEVYR